MSPPLVPEALRRTHAVLLERQAAAEARFTELSGEVAAAKQRVAWQPEVADVLDVLQEKEHQRAVGVFERLLSSLLREVLPGEREVVFDLHIERNAPALDVFIRKGAGEPLEDPYSGGGGSVTNVLSAGLRMIALVRSGMRPFLVLDEPDCWLKPEHAPAFGRVIQEASQNLGIQVLFVSHHDEALFDGIFPHRLFLERTTEGLRAAWRSKDTPEWTTEQPGIRSILLEHCQSHTHTFLPLAPGITYLSGDNDIGKSVIPMALRAMFYGGANDTLIQHHAAFAQVTVDFGPDRIVRWRRNTKGKDKEIYTLIDPASTEPVRSTVGARALPTWLAAFGIAPIDGLDVQLGHQKKPVFLLDLSAQQRAKVLAIGSEAGHVQAMMALDRQDLTEAKATVKAGEKELEALYRRRRTLQPVRDRLPEWNALTAQADDLERQRGLTEKARMLAARWRSAEAMAARARPLRGAMAPSAPAWRAPLTPLRRTAERWTHARWTLEALSQVRRGGLPIAPPAPIAPQLRALAAGWRQAAILTEAAAPLRHPAPAAPLRRDPLAPLRRTAERWTSAAAERTLAARVRAGTTPNLPQAPTTPRMAYVASRWESAHATARQLACVRRGSAPAAPSVSNTTREARRLAEAWRQATARHGALVRVTGRTAPPTPDFSGLSVLRALIARWTMAQAAESEAQRESRAMLQEEQEILGLLEKTECPTCKRSYHQEHPGACA